MTGQLFVQFLFPCKCGTDLEIHGQPFDGIGPGMADSVNCPNCNAEHLLPTRALRLYYRVNGNTWRQVEQA